MSSPVDAFNTVVAAVLASAQPQGGSVEAAAQVVAQGSLQKAISKLTLDEYGVVYTLGIEGHKNSGMESRDVALFCEIVNAYIQNQNAAWRKRLNLKYDPLQEILYDTVEKFLSNRVAIKSHDRKWHRVILITHTDINDDEDQIFLGEYFTKSELQAFASTYDPAQLKAFRDQFHANSQLELIACSVAKHGPGLGLAVRDLLGLKGSILMPKVDIKFDKTLFILGTPVSEGSDNLRDLTEDEWLFQAG